MKISTMATLAALLSAATLPSAGFAEDAPRPTLHGSPMPAYLSVPKFKSCLKQQSFGSYDAWCLPARRAAACPSASWRKLKGLKGGQAVPACTAAR